MSTLIFSEVNTFRMLFSVDVAGAPRVNVFSYSTMTHKGKLQYNSCLEIKYNRCIKIKYNTQLCLGKL